MRLVLLPIVLLLNFSLFSQNYKVSEIPPALLENANSVTRLKQYDITISNVDEMKFIFHGVYTILNKNGREDFYPAVLYDKVKKVRNVELKVYDKNGEEIEKFKKKDFLDISAVSDVSLYEDDRALVMHYTPKEYPYTLEFTYEMDSKDTADIPSFSPLSTYNSSVQEAKYSISVAPTLQLNTKIIDADGVIQTSGGAGTQKYSAKNLEAIEQENQSPGFDKITPKVLFSLNRFSLKGEIGNAESWEEFGIWMNSRLLSGVSELPEKTKNDIRNLVQGADSDLEKARRVYEYMQDRTRYISVQIGIGGWRPMSAGEVDRLGYGDCKGLTNYTQALLAEAGVPSYYTIVYGSQKKEDIMPDFTSIQGNHIILAIPQEEDYVWLECTSQELPFGFIGSFTDDRDVVLITPEGGKIAHTKKYELSENRLVTKGTVTLDALGNLDVLAEVTSEGLEYYQHFYVANKKEDEKKDHYKEYWDYIDNIGLNSMEHTNDKVNVVFNEKIDFIAGSYASFAGENMLFSVNVLDRITYIPKRYKNRKWPLQISRGFHNMDEVTIQLPDGFRLASVPEPITLESKFGIYHSEIEITPTGDLLYKRDVKIFEGEFPKEDYGAYRNFMKKVAKYDEQKIILTKS